MNTLERWGISALALAAFNARYPEERSRIARELRSIRSRLKSSLVFSELFMDELHLYQKRFLPTEDDYE
jgi:hypothetical protein